MRSVRFLERSSRRFLRFLDAAATRLYGFAWNPIHQSGAVAAAMLLLLIVTGLYLVLFYRIGSPAASVARIAADPWLGGWIRSLHRYATDLFVIAVMLHMMRMFAQGRSWGPRAVAWISGLALIGAGFVCAWTGFVMAWDAFGERLARDGARLMDTLPILSEPLSRIFAGDGPVPSAFFFVNLFIHIGLPLAMGVMLWLHVSRVARPVLLPPKRLAWTLIGALVAIAVVAPAPLGHSANPFRIDDATPVDLTVAWWLPVSERLSPGAAWGVVLALIALMLLVPRLARRPREGILAPSMVDPRLCTGCEQCAQDCPWEAISMVPRDDDRPTLVASVDPSRCVSCGVCAGSCAPMAIGPPGRTGRDQRAILRDEVFPDLGRDTGKIVAVCCAQAPLAHVTELRGRGAFVYPVSCVGNLHSSVVELFIREGCSGVIIYGCPSRDCLSREGPVWLDARLFHEREAELQARVDRRRVRVATIAPGHLQGALVALDDVERELKVLQGTMSHSDDETKESCDHVRAVEERR